MKNLKKVLSLALAFAMVLGLCIGASAAQDVTTLTDWNEVENKDAATLLNAFNIMQGNDDGTFAPNDNVTRAQAAKMISVALWGGNDDVALYNAGNIGGYTDVVAGSWYMGYVNYMTVQSIVTGKGEGVFDPNGTVTGYELLKMCLVSLGYSPATEGMTGAGWDVKTMALATRPGFQNLTANTTVTNWNAPLSRMNAATIISNMINRNTVKYNLQAGVGGNVTSMVEANKTTFAVDYLKMTERTGTLVANESGSLGTITAIDKDARGYKGENAIVNLDATKDADGKAVAAETVNLVLASTADQLGSQVKAYYKGTRFVYAAVSDSSEVEPTFAKVAEGNGALTNGDEHKDDDGKTVSDVTYYLNGKTDAMTDVYSVDKNGKMTVKDNASVKFLDTDGNGYINTVVAFTYENKDVKSDSAKIKDANDAYTFGTTKVLKTACDFEAKKGDKVMTRKLTNVFGAEVQHGYVMETVEGKVTRASAPVDGISKTVYIDGVKYTNNTAIAGLGIDSEGTFWLFANGNIQGFEGTKTAAAGPDGYALVYKAGFDKTGTTTTIGGKENVTVQVAVVLPDGTDKIFNVGGVVRLVASDETGYDAKNPTYKVEAATNLLNSGKTDFVAYKGLTLAPDTDQLVPYSLNEDGTINLYGEVSGANAATQLGTITGTDYYATGTAVVKTSDAVADKRLTADSVTYVQTAKDDEGKHTTEKWVVYKGLAVPSFQSKTTTNTSVIFSDRFEKNDKLKIDYMMLGIDGITLYNASQESPLFVILTTPELVAKDTYEAKIYNGSTNKVETVQYKGASGKVGEFYTAFNTETGFVAGTDNANMIVPDTDNAGFITNFADNSIRLHSLKKAAVAADSTATPPVTAEDAEMETAILADVSKDTKYYSVDIANETAEQITASDIAVQMSDEDIAATTTVHGYQAVIVVNEKGVATTVIVLADATAIPAND